MNQVVIKLFISLVVCGSVTDLQAQKDYSIDSLLFEDNFDNLRKHWVLETQQGVPAKLTIQKNTLVIDAKKDATVWFNQRLSGSILIE